MTCKVPIVNLERQTQDVNMSEGEKKQVVVKVGMLGDVQVGKTSLMYKYVEGKFNEDYIMTLGRHTKIFFFSAAF